MAITTGATTSANLSGLYKEVYADRLENLTPKGLHLQSDVAFAQRSKIGNLYHQPVLLQHEHGFTYAGNATTSAFALNGNITGLTKDAQIAGSYMVLQSALAYSAASRAVKGGKQAFLASTELLVTNMWESAKKRLEIDLFYGQDEIGTVATYDAGPDPFITITAAEFAPGIWAGMEGAQVQIFDAAARGTFNASFLIKTVDVDRDTRKITFDNTTKTVTNAPAAGDFIYFGGANNDATGAQWDGTTENSMVGLHNICANSGTLFNVNGGTYSLWKGNPIDAGTTDLSFHTIQKAVAATVGKGAAGDMCLYIPAVTWANVMTDQAALRRFTGSEGGGGAYEVGAESLKFWTQAGSIEVKPSIYVKEGYSYLIDPKDFMRVGSSDCSFKLPGRDNEFFRELDSNAGYELRLWSDQALFTHAPGHCARINNIVNS